jgi:hypothetical protein
MTSIWGGKLERQAVAVTTTETDLLLRDGREDH